MNISKILKMQIQEVTPEKKEISNIERTSLNFCKELREKLKKSKINAEVFIGGSVAKHTLIKKKKYDVDIFVRFDLKYKYQDISEILNKILKNKKAKKIHGSRDYFQIEKNKILMEIVPVLKIKKPEQAENVTDLSYFHVNYVLKQLRKNKKIADEIKLAKSFIHANNLYGAESYIHGFSGYSIELLICHYKSFLSLAKDAIKNNKIIIDDSKFYKKKSDILIELNESKFSPIILIDPTFKQRNVLACLSEESFLKFKEICKKFLKNPSLDFFHEKDIGKLLKQKYGKKLIKIKLKTKSQAGDIAGTKSKKFFDFFVFRLKEEFDVKANAFEYAEDTNTAYLYLIVEKKKDDIRKGPEITDIHNLTRFKKAHKNAFIKNSRAYAKIKHDLSFRQFLNNLKSEKKILKDMKISEFKLIH